MTSTHPHLIHIKKEKNHEFSLIEADPEPSIFSKTFPVLLHRVKQHAVAFRSSERGSEVSLQYNHDNN